MNRLFLLLSFIASVSQIRANESRFHRLIRLYNNYEYLLENRDIFFKYEKAIYNSDTIFDARDEMGIYDDDNNNFFLSYQSKKHRGESLREIRRTLQSSFNNYNLTRENKALSSSFLDTLHQLFDINGLYDVQLSKYLTKDPEWYTPFFQLVSSLKGSISFDNKKGFDKDLEAINDSSLKFDWINDRKYNATVIADVSPALCVGRRISVTPVYHALKIERKLIVDSIVSSQFSDETIISIARLLAKKEKHNAKKIENVNEFKRELDSIIVKDSAVERKNLRYISPLDIDNIVFCKRHAFISKPRLRLFSTSRLQTSFLKNDISYPFDVYQMYDDTSFNDFRVNYKHLIGVDIEWGIPISSFMFLNIRGYRNLFSTEREIKFFNKNDNIIWDEVLDIRWDLVASFLVTNNFVIQAGVDNLPAWVLAPRKHPHRYSLNLNMYIEDYLSFNFASSYYHSGELYQSYYDWTDPFIWLNRGFALSLTVTYNFRK